MPAITPAIEKGNTMTDPTPDQPDDGDDTLTLRELIRQAAAEHPLADPRELARIVAKLTPEDELVEFYTEALVDAVRHVLGEQRNTALAGPHTAEKRQTWWDGVLAARVHVGHRQWKVVADRTVDDLTFATSIRIIP